MNKPVFEIYLEFQLDGMLQIESRSLYTYWDLLVDVGGFNDGCFLLCSILMSFYSSIAFRNDFLKGTHYEDEKSNKTTKLQSTDQFQSVLKHFEDKQHLDPFQLNMIHKFESNTKILRDSFFSWLT